MFIPGSSYTEFSRGTQVYNPARLLPVERGSAALFGAMVSAEQYAAMNIQISSNQDQINTLTSALESLRNDSSSAISQLRNLLAEEQRKNSVKGSSKPLALVSTKQFEGG